MDCYSCSGALCGINEMKTTNSQFESLYEILDKARLNSETVKVSREALSNLLIDHSELQARQQRQAA